MTGLYIHIPFCRRKCSYCAFYSVAHPDAGKEEVYRMALVKEAESVCRKAGGRIAVSTLYMGGGTPSLLSLGFYEDLLSDLSAFFDFDSLQEATFEANPEHLDAAYLRGLYECTPFRRLSIGVQSFFDDDLRRLNRKHTAAEALAAIENARSAGFSNLSVDLIYGLHESENDSHWHENLEMLAGLDLPHFSAYALTVEPRTILARQLEQGRERVAGEDLQEKEYFYLQDFAARCGYEAYEISNYAREGWRSRHNSSYWQMRPYIGLGTAAHSFYPAGNGGGDGDGNGGGERCWNPSDLSAYLADPVGSKQRETLTETDLYHEYVMTALRTVWGVEDEVMKRFSPSIQAEFRRQAEELVARGQLERRGEGYAVPPAKRFLTDGISVNFF